jgi:hypothetical protein
MNFSVKFLITFHIFDFAFCLSPHFIVLNTSGKEPWSEIKKRDYNA